jgi:glycosyltransferase involved in cell wall biosynthesis
VSGAAEADVRHALPRAHVEVVPNAVDVAWWLGVRPTTTGEVTLLSVMRLTDRKRPLALLRMLRDVRRLAPGVPLRAVIVGTGPLEQTLRRQIHWHGLDDWVTLAGLRSASEIRELCARSDVYIAPATQESFGLAALEARAAGLPVVAMRSGGVRDFVQHGIEGLLCDDDADMTRALTRLALDDRLRQRLRDYNIEVAPSADWANALARFESVYALAESRLLSSPRPRRIRTTRSVRAGFSPPTS